MNETPGTVSPAPWRRVRLLALATGVVATLAHLAYHFAFTIDDAYITFRYSRNLVRGLGLVFNPGEPVKGYSNTLLTLLCALPELVGSDPSVFAKLLGAGACLAVLYGAFRLADAVTADGSAAPGYVAVLLAFNTPFIFWSVGGLETGLQSALVLGVVAARFFERRAAHRWPLWSTVAGVLLVLNRPESIGLLLAAAGYELWLCALARRFDPRLLVFLLVPAAVYGLELWVSAQFYGRPFPQTFYAKVHDTSHPLRALRSLHRKLLEQLTPGHYTYASLQAMGFSTALLGLCALPLLHKRMRALAGAMWLMVIAQLAFIARVGSDWMQAGRFIAPVAPLLMLLCVLGIAQLAQTFPRRRGPVELGLALSLLWLLAPDNLALSRKEKARGYVGADYHLDKGARIAGLLPPGSSMSSYDVGGQGYAGDLHVVDTAGLTEPLLQRCFRGKRHKRCKRRLAKLDPDYLRIHTSKHRWLRRYGEKSGRYAAVDNGKPPDFIHHRVFLAALPPPHATALPRTRNDVPQVVAYVSPDAVRTDAPLSLQLYIARTDGALQPLATRTLLLVDADGERHPCTHRPLALRLGPGAWLEGRLFIDRVRCQAPGRPGHYAVEVKLGAHVQRLGGGIDVLDDAAAAERAAALDTRGRAESAAGRYGAAHHTRTVAFALHPSAETRRWLHRAAIDYARSLVQPRGKRRLPSLQAARRVLHAAVTTTGAASEPLSAALADNADARARCLQGDCATE